MNLPVFWMTWLNGIEFAFKTDGDVCINFYILKIPVIWNFKNIKICSDLGVPMNIGGNPLEEEHQANSSICQQQFRQTV